MCDLLDARNEIRRAHRLHVDPVEHESAERPPPALERRRDVRRRTREIGATEDLGSREAQASRGNRFLIRDRDALTRRAAVRCGDEHELARGAIVLPELRGVGAEQPRQAAADALKRGTDGGIRLSSGRRHQPAQVALEIRFVFGARAVMPSVKASARTVTVGGPPSACRP